MRRTNWLLLAGAVALVAIPLSWHEPTEGDSPFSGADEQAQGVIAQQRPGYQPWARPLWQPPSHEIAGLLFAVQAALGAAAVGYCLGDYCGQQIGRRQDAPHR
jgi:cobalt/nickel transport protein